ncbi:hypothetical protein KP509_25G056500 [Ceratopteris richardii]|uniref:Uncharacterized protein n=1 Tax=Ceratopteris richardii TaxID=49495 RepID=A0A8T2RQJ3_CERRI|nr:hypothetical protein KP509_25G056500 [Ceratopteris richardii]
MAYFSGRRHAQQHFSVPASVVAAALAFDILLLSMRVTCRTVPTSPLSDKTAEELARAKVQPPPLLKAKLPLQEDRERQLVRIQPLGSSNAPLVKDWDWRLRVLSISVNGNHPEGEPVYNSPNVPAHPADRLSISSGKTVPSKDLYDEERQVPVGADPLHHTNNPSSP